MKALTLCFCLFFASCSTHVTTGNWDQELRSNDPYSFRFQGSLQQAFISLKRTLIEQGFGIADFDSMAGTLTTHARALGHDERLDISALATAMVGVSTSMQSGYFTFIFSQSEPLTVDMHCYGMVQGEQQLNAFSKRDLSNAAKLPQGHPLPMKMKQLISQRDPRFSLDSTSLRPMANAVDFGLVIGNGGRVADVVESSIASVGGIQKGDKIVSVSNTYVSQLSPRQILRLMDGPVGSYVNVAVEREGQQLTLSIQR